MSSNQLNWVIGLAVVAGLGWGCAGPVEIEDKTQIMPLVLTPIGDMIEQQTQLELIADKWSAATGTELYIGDNGVPMYYVDELDACAVTNVIRKFTGKFVRIQSVQVRRVADPRCNLAHNLMHEIGHAVSDYGVDGFFEGHTSGKHDLMYADSNNRIAIDEASLIEVCSHRECGAFAPEMPSVPND